MFATVLGALPRPSDAATDDDAVRRVLAAQEAAGLELLSDGGLRWRTAKDVAAVFVDRPGGVTVEGWRLAAGSTKLPVKQVLPGPYTLGVQGGDGGARDRRALTFHLAEALNAELRALRGAGCPLAEIEEPGAIRIGEDDAERRLFRDAQERLGRDLDGIHLSLAILGGSADAAGAATILAPPYASFGFDLIAGPDNWRLIRDVPGERGVVCGALSPAADAAGGPELLVWAAQYAASSGDRGIDRVGLANAPGLDRLPWDAVERKLRRLAEAAHLASAEGRAELPHALDPRAISSRSAAAGRYVPRPRRRPPGPGRA